MKPLTDLKAHLAAATPGPWEHEQWGIVTAGIGRRAPQVAAFTPITREDSGTEATGSETQAANAALCVAAVNALPALIEVAERASAIARTLPCLDDGKDGCECMPCQLDRALAALESP